MRHESSVQHHDAQDETQEPSHHGSPIGTAKSLTAEARVDGKWVEIGSLDNNRTRLIKMDFEKVKTTAVRVRVKETYGRPTVKLFEVRCYENAYRLH